MSDIYYGPRQQVIADITKLNGQIIRTDTDMFSIWHTPLNPPKHITFVLDVCPDLSMFKPRADRHLAFLDQTSLPKLAASWASKHKDKISLKPASNPTREQLFSTLTSGKIGIRLTPEAADLLLDLRPRGAQSLYWPLQQIKDLELPEPVTADSLMGQWPTKHEIDAYKLFKALGSRAGLELADKVSSDRAWGGLEILASMCKHQPVYLDYLELVKQQITNKKLKPKTALAMFARLCYLHKQDKLTLDVLSSILPR